MPESVNNTTASLYADTIPKFMHHLITVHSDLISNLNEDLKDISGCMDD